MSKVLTEMVNHNHDILIEEHLLNEMFRGTRAKANLKWGNKDANRADKVAKKLKDHLDFANKNQNEFKGENKEKVIASDEKREKKLRDKLNDRLSHANKHVDKGEKLLTAKYGKMVGKYTKSPRYRRKFVAKGKLSKLADPELFRKIADGEATNQAEPKKVKSTGELKTKLNNIKDSVE